MANKSLWKDEYLYDVYELAKSGCTEGQMAKILGISRPTFLNWERKRRLLRMGLEKGREKWRKRIKKTGGNEISEFVFNGLSADMKRVWDRLREAERAKSPRHVMELILKGHSKSFRQYLFIHCLTMSGFQITRACRRVGIPLKTFEKWRKYDDEFAELFRQVVEAKKDLCESQLLRLVRKGSEAATIYSVKALCQDRGYREKVSHDVKVSGEISHSVLTFDRIRKYLSSECQMEILGAMEKVRQLETERDVASQNLLPPHLSNLPPSLKHFHPIDTQFVSNGGNGGGGE